MKKWALGLLIALPLIGCSSNTAGLRIDGASQSVLFGDQDLGERISVEDIATTSVDGRVRGSVRLMNKETKTQHIQYRFYWYDNDGLEVNSKLSSWKQAVMVGMETITLSEVSVNPDGKQFRFHIQELKN